MAGEKIPGYVNGLGETLDTATSDGVRRALADLSNRLAELETRPASAVAALSGDDATRVARLESVVSIYFRDEFRDYDATMSGEPVKG